MSVQIPVLAVIGRKHSGKTTLIEGLVSELVKKGFQVAAAKHVSNKDFTMDTKGKDTWRYSTAGANPVMVVSDREMTTKVRSAATTVSLDRLSKTAVENKASVMILEGFSSIVLKDRRVGKIICVRNRDEYDEYKKKAEGEVLAYCSIHPTEKKVLDTKNDLPPITEKATAFIGESQRILEILCQLAGLDCHKCGRASCWELAEDIYRKKAKFDDCIPLKLRPKIRTTIAVRNVEVPIQPFVAEIVRKTILGMVSTLKGVNIRGEEQIHIDIT